MVATAMGPILAYRLRRPREDRKFDRMFHDDYTNCPAVGRKSERAMRLTRLCLFILLVSAAPVGAGVITNGSFESGLSGWSVSIDTYLTPFHDGDYPAGTVANAGSFLSSQLPADGISFALLGSQEAGGISFGNTGGPWNISISQTISLDAGASLSGLAFIYNGDYISQEDAWVHILDSTGHIVATPWHEWSGDPAFSSETIHTSLGQVSPWTLWSWQPSVSGTYTVSLGVTTRGDNRLASFAGFDSVRVPEPSTLGLFALGVLATAVRRRRKIR